MDVMINAHLALERVMDHVVMVTAEMLLVKIRVTHHVVHVPDVQEIVQIHAAHFVPNHVLVIVATPVKMRAILNVVLIVKDNASMDASIFAQDVVQIVAANAVTAVLYVWVRALLHALKLVKFFVKHSAQVVTDLVNIHVVPNV